MHRKITEKNITLFRNFELKPEKSAQRVENSWLWEAEPWGGEGDLLVFIISFVA